MTDPDALCQSWGVVLRAPDPASPPPRPDLRDVYTAEFAWVYRTLRRLGGRERDLEDLAHDVFIVVHRRLGDYDPQRPLRPWLMGIAFRVVSDYRRRASFGAEELSEAAADTASAPRQEEAVAARERRELVLAALDALDLDQRAVFVAHELDGTAIPELADALGVSVNTLYSRLRLARPRFAAAVARLTAAGGRAP